MSTLRSFEGRVKLLVTSIVSFVRIFFLREFQNNNNDNNNKKKKKTYPFESNLLSSFSFCLKPFFNLSQTSPGFYVSSVQVFENTEGKGEIARHEQFLLFPQYFLPVWITFCHFYQISNCRLLTLSVWKSLKFVIWDRVNMIKFTIFLPSIFSNHPLSTFQILLFRVFKIWK